MKEKIFKKGFKKRLFSIVLALAMVLSLMPGMTLTVQALEGYDEVLIDGVTFLYNTALLGTDYVGLALICERNGLIAEKNHEGDDQFRRNPETMGAFQACRDAGHIGEKCTVTFDMQGHGIAPESQIMMQQGQARKPEDPYAEGLVFGGWFEDSDCNSSYNFDLHVDRDITLYAKWTEAGGSGSPNPDDMCTCGHTYLMHMLTGSCQDCMGDCGSFVPAASWSEAPVTIPYYGDYYYDTNKISKSEGKYVCSEHGEVITDDGYAIPAFGIYCKAAGHWKKAHTHTDHYGVTTTTSTNDTLTWYCEDGDCPIGISSANPVSLTLSASSANYSGEPVEATITDTNNAWATNVNPTLPTITYEAKEGSYLTDSKAVNVGSYTASITEGTATASVDFEIKPAKLFDTNTYWDFNSTTGTLTISGTGAMPEFTLNEIDDTTNRPWDSFKDDITSVVVEDGVTTVGKFALYNCGSLASAKLGNTVEVLGDDAFELSGIEEITLPDSLKTIRYSAFFYCKSLKTVNLGKGVETIGKYAFQETDLTSITIPGNVKTINEGAFYYCSSLTKVELGKGLETIGAWAFENTALKDITIPNSVKTIDKGAFGYIYDGENDSPLESFTIKGYAIVNAEGQQTAAYNYFLTKKPASGSWKYINLDAAPTTKDSEFAVSDKDASLTYITGKAEESTLHIDGIALSDVYQSDATTTIYEGVYVTCDGNPLEENKDYKVTEGSVKVTFTEKFLNDLPVGSYTIKTYLNGTEAASIEKYDYVFETKIAVKPKPSTGGSSTPATTPTYKAPNTSVGYDNNPMNKTIGLLAIAAVVGYVVKKKED